MFCLNINMTKPTIIESIDKAMKNSLMLGKEVL